MEQLLLERRQSICYKRGDIFRKYLKYGKEENILREKIFSEHFKNLGINTPTFQKYGYSQERHLFYIDYEYKNIKNLDNNDFDKNNLKDVVDIIKTVTTLNYINYYGLSYWYKEYIPSLQTAAKYVDMNYGTHICENIQGLKAKDVSVAMHGDLTFENIGIDRENQKIIIFDFGNAGCSIPYWDIAYLIGSSNLKYSKFLYELSPVKTTILNCILIVSAVRLGRSIRKKEDITEKEKSFIYWSEKNLL